MRSRRRDWTYGDRMSIALPTTSGDRDIRSDFERMDLTEAASSTSASHFTYDWYVTESDGMLLRTTSGMPVTLLGLRLSSTSSNLPSIFGLVPNSKVSQSNDDDDDDPPPSPPPPSTDPSFFILNRWRLLAHRDRGFCHRPFAMDKSVVRSISVVVSSPPSSSSSSISPPSAASASSAPTMSMSTRRPVAA